MRTVIAAIALLLVPGADGSRAFLNAARITGGVIDDDFDADLFRVIGLDLAKRVGPALVTTANGKRYVLERAILPGETIGDFPTPPADVTSLSFDKPEIMVLNGRTGLQTTDGYLALTELDLIETLDGKLELLGMLDVVGSGVEPRQLKTFTPTSTGALDWAIGKFTVKLLGVKIKPGEGDVAATVE